MSIMRVHSTLNDLPHFPFLYPQDKADAMRSALQLRYQLLPHMYSLAHVQYTQGLPVSRPLFMQFPGDLSVVNTVRAAAIGGGRGWGGGGGGCGGGGTCFAAETCRRLTSGCRATS